MPIRVQCDQCGSVMNVRDDYAGRERSCPKCKATFVVPAASPPVAADSGGAAAELAPADVRKAAEAASRTRSKSAKSASATAKASGESTTKASSTEFDPLDVLGGSSSAPRPSTKPANPRSPRGARGAGTAADEEFDPLSVLGGQAAKPGQASPVAPARSHQAETATGPASAPPAADDFDPMAVLAAPAVPPAASPPPPAPAVAEATPGDRPQPRRPSWAKAAPPPEKDDWSDPPAAPPAPPPAAAPPQPKRPSWAKAAPPPEKDDWSDPPPTPAEPAPVAPPQPKRPSWAKAPPPPEVNDWSDPPAAGTAPSGPAATQPVAAPAPPASPPADLSPAALAAAAAMGGTTTISADNPLLAEPEEREPWIDRERLVAGLKRQVRVLAVAAPVAIVLFGISWWFVAPSAVRWTAVGERAELEFVEVTGQVTLDGKPLSDARVIFLPRGQALRSAEGWTDSDGRYVLEFAEGVTGVPAGKYRVQVQKLNEVGRDVVPSAFGELTKQIHEVGADGGTIDVAISTETSRPAT